ncbi:lipid A deacylase LpxR family protein [Subsaxibacter sp. CAU 1640]|uniref:lipid A deacylase LpxR family protein n=1 Tax=Subsaxibacter sp. CAU 1640 TaxID=2933271 RepID=UPI002006A7A1|nr:lipid A deacylase LpxR family protein [Subsaxibacter sp. CAU 1640]MCK7590599.1 lipid A deacylase LpxR family protein [Subsaxibacter sp. CAU 1640]
MKKLLSLIIILCSAGTVSQESEDHPKKVIRVISENDFWLFKNKTDVFYTQGLKIECSHLLKDSSRLKKWWPFVLDKSTENITGFSIGQNLYTSSDITVPSIMLDDRPYSAWLYISKSVISNDSASAKRLSSEVYLGVIGPMALGEEVQSTWHEWIGSPDPKGWDNQIKNDIGINLHLKYEKGLYSYASPNLTVDFVPNAEVLAGTVINTVGVGTTTRISIFNASSYFQNIYSERSIIKAFKEPIKPSFIKSFKDSNISLFTTNSANVVVWNSLLQGGLFSQDSPYLIDHKDIERVYINLEYGISYSNPYFNISYTRAFRTREFKQQEFNHQWGKFQVLIKI